MVARLILSPQYRKGVDLINDPKAIIVLDFRLEVLAGTKTGDMVIVRGHLRIVKCDYSSGANPARPIAPVPLYSFERVVTIDKNEVKRSLDLIAGVPTQCPNELNSPLDIPSSHLIFCNQLPPADSESASKERIDGIQSTAFGKSLCNETGVCPFSNTNLHGPLGTLSILPQFLTLIGGCLRTGIIDIEEITKRVEKCIHLYSQLRW